MFNKIEDNSSAFSPSPTTDKKFFIVLHRLIKILQKYIGENEFSVPIDQKYQKSDSLFKIVEYFMHEVETQSNEEKTKNCQKCYFLKSVLLKYLKISPEVLEFISEKVAQKITKGKFQLSMVLHLSKNIAKSTSFEKKKTEQVKKIARSLQGQCEKKDKQQIQNSFKVKLEMPTLQSEKQFELQEKPITNLDAQNLMRFDQMQRNCKLWSNNKQFWAPYIQQQYNKMYFPQFYYYAMQ